MYTQTMKKTLAIFLFLISSISPEDVIENCPKTITNNVEEVFAEEQKQLVNHKKETRSNPSCTQYYKYNASLFRKMAIYFQLDGLNVHVSTLYYSYNDIFERIPSPNLFSFCRKS